MPDGQHRRSFLRQLGTLPALTAAPFADTLIGEEAKGTDAPSPCNPGRGGWWESASSSMPIFVRPRPGKDAVFPLNPAPAAAKRLHELRDRGVAAVEVYAPAEGGNSFLGLDTIDRYRFEPRAGTMADFLRLVKQVHERGMKIVSIDNLGYSSVDAVDFVKACDDVRAGRDTRESRFFLWADSKDAPPPGAASGNTVFMVRPAHLPGSKPGTFYESSKHEYWQFSARANRFYWTKWAGVDHAGNKVRLPQYNWSGPEFPEEAEKIVRFWMDTGIDGMLIDAVNWYVGCTWQKNRKAMTDAISSYGGKFSQPEGAGAFRDDPVAWVTEGGWTCIQDYGLAIYWEKGSNVITNALTTGDPRPIETALRNYHDRVVEAGGVLYFNPPKFEDARKSHLAFAAAIAAGELICLAAVIDNLWSPVPPDEEEGRMLKLKSKHPALHSLALRRELRTADPAKHYAILRTARAVNERVIAVMNFQPEPQTVGIDLSSVNCVKLTDLSSGADIHPQTMWSVPLPAFGYGFYRLG